jgi:hypothetical protein
MSSSYDSTLRIFDLNTFKNLASIKYDSPISQFDSSDDLSSFGYSQLDKQVFFMKQNTKLLTEE